MTARSEVVALLSSVLTPLGFLVLPYSRSLTPSKPTVMVRIDDVEPSSVPNAARKYNFALICVVPQIDVGTADDELDNFLEDVLFALDDSTVRNNAIWTKATRATFEEKFPAYQVDISIHTKKE